MVERGGVVDDGVRRLDRAGAGRPVLLIVSGRRSPSIGRADEIDPHDDACIMAELSRLGTELSEFSDEDIAELFLPALRADYQALTGYSHVAGSILLDCPVRVFYGDADPRLSKEDASVWEQCSSQEIEVRSFAGGHFYFRDDPDELTVAIEEEIDLWRGSRSR